MGIVLDNFERGDASLHQKLLCSHAPFLDLESVVFCLLQANSTQCFLACGTVQLPQRICTSNFTWLLSSFIFIAPLSSVVTDIVQLEVEMKTKNNTLSLSYPRIRFTSYNQRAKYLRIPSILCRVEFHFCVATLRSSPNFNNFTFSSSTV